MTKVRVHNLTVSVDGFAAGRNQRLDAPFGDAPILPDWQFRVTPGSLDEACFRRGLDGVGASIMGSNMFGGYVDDPDWKGWWGTNPPYHHPVYVLTSRARPPIEMEGGTTFHFVTDGPEAALERAVGSAAGQDVRVFGGAATVRQYLRLGLVDEMHLAIAPALVGAGERLLDDAELASRYTCTGLRAGDLGVCHAFFTRK